MFGRITKTRKAKAFEYVPRYYDPEKEEMEARRKKIAAELNADHGDSSTIPSGHSLMRGNLKEQWKTSQSDKVRDKKSKLRFYLILGTLALAAYYILY